MHLLPLIESTNAYAPELHEREHTSSYIYLINKTPVLGLIDVPHVIQSKLDGAEQVLQVQSQFEQTFEPKLLYVPFGQF
jgi:hypothetical protein